MSRLSERLGHSRPVLTPARARSASWSRLSRCAQQQGAEPPFQLRPGLIAEILRLYDELKRRQNSVDDFERRALGVLEPGAAYDRGAERLVRQTRFLVAAFRDFERRSAECGDDEHMLRARLMTETSTATLSAHRADGHRRRLRAVRCGSGRLGFADAHPRPRDGSMSSSRTRCSPARCTNASTGCCPGSRRSATRRRSIGACLSLVIPPGRSDAVHVRARSRRGSRRASRGASSTRFDKVRWRRPVDAALIVRQRLPYVVRGARSAAIGRRAVPDVEPCRWRPNRSRRRSTWCCRA